MEARLLDLREKFDETMPTECSPLQRFPLDDPHLSHLLPILRLQRRRHLLPEGTSSPARR